MIQIIKNQYLKIAILLFFLLFSRDIFASETACPEVAMVKAVSGDVWVYRGGAKTFAKKAMELKKGDIVELTEQGGITIVYFKSGKDETYKSHAVIEIGKDQSIVKVGIPVSVHESQGKKIILNEHGALSTSRDSDNNQVGGQILRGTSSSSHKDYCNNK